MTKKIFRKLSDYKPREKIDGKKAFLHSMSDESDSLTLYGTIQGRTKNSITLGYFIDITMPLNYAETVKELSSDEEMHRAIKFLDELHKVRLISHPRRFELSNRLDCYIVETI